MAAAGSTRVVIAALAANGAIAAAKFAAAAWTGSAAMLSEAIHSLADTANQGLLLHGISRSARPPDARHPFGYAKEIYFWSFVVAILLFSLGAGIAIYEGVDKLRNPHPVTDPIVNYVVLGVAIVFECLSTYVAVREFNKRRGATGMMAALRSSKDPALFTVLLEDTAALAGLATALAGIAASHLLGWSMGDAIASIVIGLILGYVAAFMAVETKSLIIGEAASEDLQRQVSDLLRGEIRTAGPLAGVGRPTTMHLGPEHVIAAVPLDFRDQATATEVEATIAALEARVRAAHPEVKHLFLEARPLAQAPASPALATSAPQPSPAATVKQLAPAPRGNHPPAQSSKKKKKRKGR